MRLVLVAVLAMVVATGGEGFRGLEEAVGMMVLVVVREGVVIAEAAGWGG